MTNFFNVDNIDKLMSFSVPDGTDHWDVAQSFGNGHSCEVETGLLYYSLVRRLRPKVAVELGTFWGYAATWIGMGLRDNHQSYPHLGSGLLHTIDRDTHSQAAKMWSYFGVQSYICFYQGNTRELQLNADAIEMLFFDDNPEGDSIMRQWEIYKDKMAPRALLFFHDSSTNPCCAESPDKIIEVSGGQKFVFPNMRGLVVVQLKG